MIDSNFFARCGALLVIALAPGLVAAQANSAANSPPAPTARAPATGATPAAPATVPASPLDRATRRGTVLIAGQPTADDLAALRKRGITRVVNLRTPEEMADRDSVPFDEAALLQSTNIDYVTIPIGGANYPLRPEALEAYAKALNDVKGDVLLHCASGGRASTLHAAYEVKYLGRSPDEALRSLEPYGGWPLPLERLTGIELRVERRAAPSGK